MMDHKAADDSHRNALERFKTEAWPLLPSLLRVALLLTRDGHQAEDLTQETMMRAFRHIETFQTGTNMKAWLMTILRRTHTDLYRRDARWGRVGSLDAMAVEPPAPQDVETQHDRAWTEPGQLLDRFDDETVERALLDLPEPMRWTLLLVDVEQLPLTDAAQVLGVAVGTVKSRASRARALLRSALLPIAQQRGWIPAAAGE